MAGCCPTGAVPGFFGEVALDGVLALLQFYMAKRALDAFEYSKDKLYEAADRSMLLAEELFPLHMDLRGRDQTVYDFVNNLEEHVPCGVPGARMKIAKTAGLASRLMTEMKQLDGYQCGAREALINEAGKQFIINGMEGVAQGVAFEDAIEDQYYELKWNSITHAAVGSPPPIGQAFASAARVFSSQAEIAGQRVNSAVSGLFGTVEKLGSHFSAGTAGTNGGVTSGATATGLGTPEQLPTPIILPPTAPLFG